MFKEIIEYGNPKTLEKAMRKVNLCYGQNKNKRDNIPNWKNKRCECFEQKKERHTLEKKLEIITRVIKEVILRVINNIILPK